MWTRIRGVWTCGHLVDVSMQLLSCISGHSKFIASCMQYHTHNTFTYTQYIHIHTVHSHTYIHIQYSLYSITVETKHTSCAWHVLMCQSTAGESPLGNTCMFLSVSLNCAIVTTELSLLGDVQRVVVICRTDSDSDSDGGVGAVV